jgi:hypothetical protein
MATVGAAAMHAALVDHYFAAWQEASAQLARRERELADLRRNTPAKVVAVRAQTAPLVAR